MAKKEKILISVADENATYQTVLEVEIESGKLKSLLKSLKGIEVSDEKPPEIPPRPEPPTESDLQPDKTIE